MTTTLIVDSVIDQVILRFGQLAEELPPGRAYVFERQGETVIAWCADHRTPHDTWCRNCSLAAVRDRRLLDAWTAIAAMFTAASEPGPADRGGPPGRAGPDDG